MHVEAYLQLPYTTVLKRDEDGDYVATVKELRGCVAHGATEGEALDALLSMKRLWIESCLADGDTVPQPEQESPLPSGKWLLRVPKTLHASLIRCAEEDEVSLNQLAVSILSKEVGVREGKTMISTMQAHAHSSSSAGSDPWGVPVERISPRWQMNQVHTGRVDPTFFSSLSDSADQQIVRRTEDRDHGVTQHSKWKN